MGERLRGLQEMATTSTAVTVTPQVTEPQEPVAVITLRPTKEQSRKKVVWTEDTVDNEYMNKKKSKCCCIYEKPRKFGESDSEDSEDECDHCYGHVERRRATRQHTAEPTHTDTTAAVQDGGASTSEPTTTITLQPSDKQTAPPDKPSELPQES